MVKSKPDIEPFLDLCVLCGKQIRPVLPGSMTGWIFSENYCSCEEPDIGKGIDPRSVSLPDFGEKYEVLSELGSGGMGSVFKALDREANKIYALKVIHSHLNSDSNSLKRFEREIETMSDFSHPGLVKVVGHGAALDGTHYLVMEYVEGLSLADLIQESGSLKEERALDLFIQIFEAVRYMHSRKIIHRDIKPSNVLIVRQADESELVKIVDFGIAKVLKNSALDATSITRTGDIFGSPYYMSPEQCQGEEVSYQSDIYSIGCLMYETLCGRPPFEDDSPVKIVLAHLYDVPKSLNSYAMGGRVSEPMEELVMNCLAKDPGHRYKSTKAVLEDLHRLKSGQGIRMQRVDTSSYSLRVARSLLGYVLAATFVFTVVLSFVLIQDYGWLVNLSKVNQLSYMQYDEKERIARELVDVASDHNRPFAQLILAEVYYDAGKLERAYDTVTGALTVLKEKGDNSQNQQAFLRLLIAIELDRQHLELADKYYRELLDLACDPNKNREGVKGIAIFRGFYLPSPVVSVPDVVGDYAEACQARGYVSRASKLYQDLFAYAIKSGSANDIFNCLRMRAQIADSQKHRDEASQLRAEAASMLDKPPMRGQPQPMRDLGDDYLVSRDFKNAEALYQKLERLEGGGQLSGQSILDHLRLAYCYSLEGKLDQAKALYQKLDRAVQNNYDTIEGRRVLRAYANYCIGTEDYVQAESILSKLLRIYEKNNNSMRAATVSIKLAICLAKAGEKVRAEEIYRKARNSFQAVEFGQLQDDRVFEESKFLRDCAQYLILVEDKNQSEKTLEAAREMMGKLSPNTYRIFRARDRSARIVDGDVHFDHWKRNLNVQIR